jgi:hypothetical protein
LAALVVTFLLNFQKVNKMAAHPPGPSANAILFARADEWVGPGPAPTPHALTTSRPIVIAGGGFCFTRRRAVRTARVSGSRPQAAPHRADLQLSVGSIDVGMPPTAGEASDATARARGRATGSSGHHRGRASGVLAGRLVRPRAVAQPLAWLEVSAAAAPLSPRLPLQTGAGRSAASTEAVRTAPSMRAVSPSLAEAVLEASAPHGVDGSAGGRRPTAPRSPAARSAHTTGPHAEIGDAAYASLDARPSTPIVTVTIRAVTPPQTVRFSQLPGASRPGSPAPMPPPSPAQPHTGKHAPATQAARVASGAAPSPPLATAAEAAAAATHARARAPQPSRTVGARADLEGALLASGLGRPRHTPQSPTTVSVSHAAAEGASPRGVALALAAKSAAAPSSPLSRLVMHSAAASPRAADALAISRPERTPAATKSRWLAAGLVAAEAQRETAEPPGVPAAPPQSGQSPAGALRGARPAALRRPRAGAASPGAMMPVRGRPPSASAAAAAHGSSLAIVKGGACGASGDAGGAARAAARQLARPSPTPPPRSSPRAHTPSPLPHAPSRPPTAASLPGTAASAAAAAALFSVSVTFAPSPPPPHEQPSATVALITTAVAEGAQDALSFRSPSPEAASPPRRAWPRPTPPSSASARWAQLSLRDANELQVARSDGADAIGGRTARRLSLPAGPASSWLDAAAAAATVDSADARGERGRAVPHAPAPLSPAAWRSPAGRGRAASGGAQQLEARARIRALNSARAASSARASAPPLAAAFAGGPMAVCVATHAPTMATAIGAATFAAMRQRHARWRLPTAELDASERAPAASGALLVRAGDMQEAQDLARSLWRASDADN